MVHPDSCPVCLYWCSKVFTVTCIPLHLLVRTHLGNLLHLGMAEGTFFFGGDMFARLELFLGPN